MGSNDPSDDDGQWLDIGLRDHSQRVVHVFANKEMKLAISWYGLGGVWSIAVGGLFASIGPSL